MKAADEIKRFFKNAVIETNPTKDREVLEQVLEACEGAMGTERVVEGSVWMMMRSPITKIAAVVVIIFASCLFLTHQGQNEEVKIQQITQRVKSPAELTTFASLSFAYRQGGMEMVDKMFEEALKMAGQQPAIISLQEFSEEINNGKSERTEL